VANPAQLPGFSGLVLIDEVENGFITDTPEMWKEISHFALEHKTQIFATTHSREFLEAIMPTVDNNAKDYSLLHLEKTNGEARLLPSRATIRGCYSKRV